MQPSKIGARATLAQQIYVLQILHVINKTTEKQLMLFTPVVQDLVRSYFIALVGRIGYAVG